MPETARRRRGLDPNWVLKTGQIQRPEEIGRMLREHGFTSLGINGGSHEKFKHPELEEHLSLPHVHGDSSNIRYQKLAAQACLKILATEPEQSATAEVACQQEFEEASADGASPVDAMESFEQLAAKHTSIQKHIEAEPADGFVILRHNTYRCIGGVADQHASAEILAATIEPVMDKTSVFAETLNRAKDRLDLDVSFEDDGTIVVAQPTYGLTHAFRPFDPARDTKQIDILNELLFQIELLDDEHRQFIYGLMDESAEGVEVEQSFLPDGNIEWKVRRPHFLFAETVEFNFTTSEAGRISARDFYDLQDRIFMAEFMKGSSSKYMRKELSERFGINLKRPQGSCTMPGKHAFYKGLDFAIPVLYELPRAKKLWEDLHESDPEKLAQELVQLQEHRDMARTRLLQAKEWVLETAERENGSVNALHDRLAEHNISAGMRAYGVKPGQKCTYIYKQPSTGKEVEAPSFRLKEVSGGLLRAEDVQEALAQTWPELFPDLLPQDHAPVPEPGAGFG